MNVEEPAAPACDEIRRQKPHETGEAYEFDSVFAQLCIERALERFAILAEAPVIDGLGRDPRLARVSESGRVRHVRCDENDLSRIVG